MECEGGRDEALQALDPVEDRAVHTFVKEKMNVTSASSQRDSETLTSVATPL